MSIPAVLAVPAVLVTTSLAVDDAGSEVIGVVHVDGVVALRNRPI